MCNNWMIQFNKIMRTLKFVQHNRNFYDPVAAHKIPGDEVVGDGGGGLMAPDDTIGV